MSLQNVRITRTIPGVADWPADQRAEVAAASNKVVAGLNGGHAEPQYEWVGSVVTGPHTLVCHHRVANPELAEKHAQIGGFPCDSVEVVAEGDDVLPEGTGWHLAPQDAAEPVAT